MRIKITAVLLGVGLLALIPAGAEASFRTKASIYHAFTSSGRVRFKTWTHKGYCVSGSLAINRKDAWSCVLTTPQLDFPLDPCFSSPLKAGYVACPYQTLRHGVTIRLTRKLPYKRANHRAPSLLDQPWDIETASGWRYLLEIGPNSVVDGTAANYFAFTGRNMDALWGYPVRTQEPWTILWAPVDAARLSSMS